MKNRVKISRYKKYNKNPLFIMDKFRHGDSYTRKYVIYHKYWAQKPISKNIIKEG